MKIEALLYEKLDDGSVRCGTCPHECVIKPGKVGFCGTRTNEDGTCYSIIYGAITATAVDPIEKKPLYHFHPGHDIYSVSSIGCSFKCKNCQNYHLSQSKGSGDRDVLFVSVDGSPIRVFKTRPKELVEKMLARNCKLLAFTYNEPLIWIEYIIDVAKVARQHDIKIVLVSNGYTTPRALELLLPHFDAANIDIKAFSDDFYKKNCSAIGLEHVLSAVKTMHGAGKLVEITNLVIPTLNDGPEMLRNLCHWINEELGPGVPLHFSAYRPMHKMNIPATPPETLVMARDIARDAGLHHVYIGNVQVPGADTTFCPSCKSPVIERSGYIINTVNLLSTPEGNKCAGCGNPLEIIGEPSKKRRFSIF